MPPRLSGLASSLGLSIILLFAAPANSLARTSSIGTVAYDPPKNAIHSRLAERLKSERWLERMVQVLQMFRLPEPVTLRLESCGEVDAYYARRTVAVCYEYLQVVMRRIEAGELPDWVSADEALAGAFVDAMLHEYAHALIDQLNIPVLGREEDAADQMATFLVLHLAGSDAPALIRGTAHLYLSWIRFFQSRPSRVLSTGASERETRAHPTASQRLYNLVCIALGADRSAFIVLAKAIEMPEERGEDCGDEYQRLAMSYRTLLDAHIDRRLEGAARTALRSFARPQSP